MISVFQSFHIYHTESVCEFEGVSYCPYTLSFCRTIAPGQSLSFRWGDTQREDGLDLSTAEEWTQTYMMEIRSMKETHLPVFVDAEWVFLNLKCLAMENWIVWPEAFFNMPWKFLSCCFQGMRITPHPLPFFLLHLNQLQRVYSSAPYQHVHSKYSLPIKSRKATPVLLSFPLKLPSLNSIHSLFVPNSPLLLPFRCRRENWIPFQTNKILVHCLKFETMQRRIFEIFTSSF